MPIKNIRIITNTVSRDIEEFIWICVNLIPNLCCFPPHQTGLYNPHWLYVSTRHKKQRKAVLEERKAKIDELIKIIED